MADVGTHEKQYDIYTTILDRSASGMIEFAALPTVAQAGLVVSVVLIEAVLLYVGYGMIEDRLAPPILSAIANA